MSGSGTNITTLESDAARHLFVIGFNADGVISCANDTALEMLGADLCGQPLAARLCAKDVNKINRLLGSEWRGDMSFRLCFSDDNTEGATLRHVDGRLALDEGGAFVFSGLERLNLYEGDNKFSSMVETTGEGILVHIEGAIKYVNPALTEMLGVSLEDILSNKDPYVHLHPDDRARIMGYHRARLRGEEPPETFEYRLVNVDDSIRWISANARLLDWEGENASLVVMRDVTHLKTLKDEHDEIQKLFSRVVEAMPSYLSISSLETQEFVFANQHFFDTFGYTKEEVIGKSSKDLELWNSRDDRRELVKSIRVGEIFSTIAEGRRKNGDVFNTKVNGILLSEGESQFVIIVGDDVTEEIEREKQLEESRETAELASRTKSQFLANMSHELRTPLNAILGFSQFIRDQLLGPIEEPRYVEYANDIFSSGTHLLTIINEILDLSKVESGKLGFKETEVNVRELAVSTFNLLRSRALEYGVRLVNQVPDTDILMRADEMRLKQSLINLLSNALKFTEDGGEVKLSYFSDDQGRVNIRVSDTGVGMNDDQIAVAYEPFGQIENTYTRSDQGTGLGLPLVKAFVELHQGEMNIESELGKGTIITLTFPVERVVS